MKNVIYISKLLGVVLVAIGTICLLIVGIYQIAMTGIEANNGQVDTVAVSTMQKANLYIFDNPLPVKITSYNPVPSQTDYDPFTTADGSKITDDTRNWCAVSRDLLNWYFDFGDTITVVVWDDAFGCPRMFRVVIHDVTASYIYNTVDLLFLDNKQNFTGKGEIIEVEKARDLYFKEGNK